MRNVDADTGMTSTRSTCHEANSGVSRHFAVSFSHIGCASLMAARHETNALRVVNSIEDFEVALAGYAERRVDAVRFQCVNENSSTSTCV